MAKDTQPDAPAEISPVSSDSSPASEPAPITEDLPNMADIKGVRYIGGSNVRRISVDDLLRVGVNDPKEDLEWNADNDHFIFKIQFNASTRDWFSTQSDFRIE